MQMFNAEQLQEKWAPILNHEGLGEIQDPHKRMVTAVLLENQEKMLREESEFLSEKQLLLTPPLVVLDSQVQLLMQSVISIPF